MGNKNKWNLNIVELALFKLAYEKRIPGFIVDHAKELIKLNKKGLGENVLGSLNELIDSAEVNKESKLAKSPCKILEVCKNQ